jgi:alkanesulfonate monooxygenase SsuD/methylene tetrahydromethanopterin reductase-like flavin-dependent oxidoreductase (luciferase family)
MAHFGLIAIPTHYTIPPVELARWAEDRGFESVWFGEHSHIPTSRKTPFPLGGELPVYYKEFFDPFVGLSAAAAVTTKLKV